MADEIISLRIGRELREKMRMYRYINWSAIIRRALLEEVNKIHIMNKEKAMRALKSAEAIRKSGTFNSGRTGDQIIREWRDKRR